MSVLRITLAIVLGFLVGSAANLALISLGAHVVDPPPGVDLANMESLKAAMPTLGPRYFVFPFLAHALGTLVGALIAYLIAPPGKGWVGRVIGVMFLVGGVVAAFTIPAPKWFIVTDLVLAYIPMAWLGARLGALIKRTSR